MLPPQDPRTPLLGPAHRLRADVGEEPADGLLRAPAEEALRRRVPEGHGPLGVGADDREGRGLEHRAEARRRRPGLDGAHDELGRGPESLAVDDQRHAGGREQVGAEPRPLRGSGGSPHDRHREPAGPRGDQDAGEPCPGEKERPRPHHDQDERHGLVGLLNREGERGVREEDGREAGHDRVAPARGGPAGGGGARRSRGTRRRRRRSPPRGRRGGGVRAPPRPPPRATPRPRRAPRRPTARPRRPRDRAPGGRSPIASNEPPDAPSAAGARA